MFSDAIEITYMPEMDDPVLIAGFEGWGNALDLSKGMVDYLIEKLDAKVFGRIVPDPFYRFDENRPFVEIEEGLLKKITLPGGSLHVVQKQTAGRDMILLKAPEPSMRWLYFAEAVVGLCEKAKVKTVIGLGSMYDNVLHTDTIISAVASSEELLGRLKEKGLSTVNYKGPSAIHSAILNEARKRGIECFTLWCHCPFYLQGTTHYGLLSHLGSLLSSWAGFRLETQELDRTWKDLSKQIQGIIEKNPELQAMISDLRKSKVKVSWDTARKQDKVIHLEDFLKPK